MFGILESVHAYIRLYLYIYIIQYTYYILSIRIYIYIYIYYNYIHMLWNVSKAHSRFDVPVCHTMSLVNSPRNLLSIKMRNHLGIISLNHPSKMGKSHHQVLPFENHGEPELFLVNQRVEPNSRLHGAFASDFECEMSARYEAYAENDVPWMFFLKGFLEKKCFKFWQNLGCEPVTKNFWKMVGTKILFNKD